MSCSVSVLGRDAHSVYHWAMRRSAVLSRDGRYRYALRRTWDADKPCVLFVGLNPSTADHRVDDPTIRRCIQFALDWGFGRLAVANLFALRSTSPRALRHASDPIGPRNDAWVRRLVCESQVVVAAWGNYGAFRGRDREVAAMLPAPKCLATTMRGYPRHPLYLPRETTLCDFDAAR